MKEGVVVDGSQDNIDSSLTHPGFEYDPINDYEYVQGKEMLAGTKGMYYSSSIDQYYILSNDKYREMALDGLYFVFYVLNFVSFS